MPRLALMALALLSQAAADRDAPPARSAAADVVEALESAVADAIARAEPSVVAVLRVRGETDETTAVRGREPAPPPTDPAGHIFQGFPEAEPDFVALPGDYGSGVVVGEAGEILTAYHVIRGAARIRVRAAGRREFAAEVLAADPRSDLAVLAPRGVDPATLKLRPIPIGDANRLRKGSFLIALGNPYNAARDGKASAGWGILANTARRLERPVEGRFARGNTLQYFRYQPTLLQLDAKLNLGMSGGAVVNLRGELVGVTTTGGNAESYDAQAGYAVPMDDLGRRAVEALRQGKEVEYGFLGIAIDPSATNRVERVQPGTPADEAALVAGDTIVGVGDRPIKPDDGLSLALSAVPPGTAVKLTIRRPDGQLVEKALTIAKYPVKSNGTAPAIVTNRPDPWRGLRVDFTSVLFGDSLGDDLAERLRGGGVGIVEVASGSEAEKAGLKLGQVITEVEGHSVRTPEQFRRAVAGREGPVRLTTEMGEAPSRPVTVK